MIDYIFWCIPPVVMIAIAAYMLRGRLHREFPAFFNYLVFQIAAFTVEFPLLHWGNYYYIALVSTGLGILFSFAVLVEVVQKVVDGTQTLRHWNIPLCCCCALAAMAVTEMWPLTASIDNWTVGIIETERTVRVAQFALAFFIVLFGAAVGISKRYFIFGIAVGFGFVATVNFWVMLLWSQRALLSRVTLGRINSAAYVISTLIWLAYAAVATREAVLRRLS
jgi:hypothetical protein